MHAKEIQIEVKKPLFKREGTMFGLQLELKVDF